MKISGLATGMDTETIIKDLMQANRIPLDKITQKKQYLQWQLDDYRATNRQLFDFSQKTFDTMILSTSFSQKTVSTSAPDDVAIKNMGSTSDFSGSISVTQLAKNSTMQSTGSITNEVGKTENSTLAELGIAGGDILIQTIGEDGTLQTPTESLTFASTDTLQTVLNKINKETGVNAFYDSKTGKIALTSKNGGKLSDAAHGAGEKEIMVSGTLGKALNLDTAPVKEGQNAEFNINGLEMSRSSNTFQVNGFEFTLKAANSKEITFSSAPDTDKIFDTVVKFVDEYNKLIEDLNKQIREPKYRDFHALSAEQKKEMTDKDIELWEEKAKSGTLRNDSDITSMLSKMRTALMGSVGKDGPTLKDIGITTSKDYLDYGKLVINEADLKKAITDDPNKVHELFAKDGKTDASEHGFARRLRTIVDDSQKVIAKRAGKVGDVNDTFTLGRNMKDMNKQIERFEERLKQVESRLWKQFNAMESAIQRLNSQSASIMSSFGGA